MASLTSYQNSAKAYWNLVKHLTPDAKIDLITMLSQSLKSTPKENTVSASKHYGVWGDDGMTDDEFVKELKAMRSFKHEDIEL